MRAPVAQRHQRRTFPRGLVLGLLGIALVIYVVWSVFAWKTALTNADAASSTFRETFGQYFTTTSTKDTAVKNLSTSLTSYAAKVSEHPCTLSGWFAWQAVLPGISQLHAACTAKAAKADVAVSAAETLLSYTTQAANVANLVKTAQTATASPSDLSAAATTWKNLANDSALRTVPFAPTGVVVKEAATAIASGFTQLNTAASSKSIATYNAAETALVNAYAKLDAISTKNKTVQTLYLKNFVTAFEAL